jgi:hypothetical protein
MPVGLVFWFFAGCEVEFRQCAGDIPRHRQIYRSVVVIPGKGDAAKQQSCPIDCDCLIILFQGSKEVLSVFDVGELNPKIVDDQYEHEFSCGVLPQS